jgi:subtilisin family serine protease
MIDSYLDRNSTFFVDPTVTLQNATYQPEHRKVVYADWYDDRVMGDSEHGTHVAGILAGAALLEEYAKFNGVAPEAKIAYQSEPLESALWFARLDDGTQIMNTVGSHIHTNSWGGSSFITAFDTWLNRQARIEQGKLFIFGVGNNGAKSPETRGYFTVYSPGSAKNILTVGALSQLQVAVDKKPDVWIDIGSNLVIATVGGSRFSWSKDPFIGETYLLRGMVTRNYSVEARDTFIMTVENCTHVQYLNSLDPRPLAGVTISNALQCDSTQFPVFWSQSALVLSLFMNAGENDAIELCFRAQVRADPEFTPTVADYSSRGPTALGIMKPEVVAPGTVIVSGRSSRANFSEVLGNDPLQIAVMDGTSMATPNVAGCVALIEQYFKDGFYKGVSLAPSSSLLRAVVVTTADPLTPGDKTMSGESGFGQVNLGKYLPFQGDNFSLHIGDVITIGEPVHLVANFSVTSTLREVRVTIAYIDAVANEDSMIPLLCDLDLIVVSPTNKIFRGNRRSDNTEERFSTVERVIIAPPELETGTYQVHVIASNPSVATTTNFSIAAVGAITIPGQAFIFEPTTTCATSCGGGTCNSNTGVCSCSAGKLGQSCQTGVESHKGSRSTVDITLPPWGLKWLTFENDDKVTGFVTFTVKPEILPGVFRVYAVEGGSRDFEQVKFGTDEFTANEDLTSTENGVPLLVRNECPYARSFTAQIVSTLVVSYALAAAIIAVIVIVVVGIVVGSIVAVIYCMHRSRGRMQDSLDDNA